MLSYVVRFFFNKNILEYRSLVERLYKMKILWVVNTIFPSLSKSMNFQPPVSGSWMYSLAKKVSDIVDIELSVVTEFDGSHTVKKVIDGIQYYLIPTDHKTQWGRVYDEINPKVVHIHGSEFPYGLRLIEQRPNAKYILSIQGLINVYAKHYFAGMSYVELLTSVSFRDVIKSDNLLQARNKFLKKGELEKQYFSKVDAVVGRTDWDKAHTLEVNNNLKYYHCDEMLREIFYTAEKWNYENCEKYSIFISAATYPIKGFHQMLKAAVLIKKNYSQLKIYVAGHKICGDGTIESEIKISGYGLFLRRLIKKYALEETIVFLGPLKAEEMIDYYLKSHVFVCPSSIENSANSIAEAQILGVPLIASYVGGTPNLVEHKITGYLYDFSDYVMLANYVETFFSDQQKIEKLTSQGVKVAERRHNVQTILDDLLNIYTSTIK